MHIIVLCRSKAQTLVRLYYFENVLFKNGSRITGVVPKSWMYMHYLKDEETVKVRLDEFTGRTMNFSMTDKIYTAHSIDELLAKVERFELPTDFNRLVCSRI